MYSRTRDFYKQFAKAFLKSDITILTDIYAGREDTMEDVHTNLIIKQMKKLKYKNVFYVSNKNNISKLLKDIHKNGDLIIVMGAGDIWRQTKNISEELSIWRKIY